MDICITLGVAEDQIWLQEPGVIVEFGNELYIRNQGDPRFPNGEVYMEKVQEVVTCTRKLMPNARLIAVGAPGEEGSRSTDKRACSTDKTSHATFYRALERCSAREREDRRL